MPLPDLLNKANQVGNQISGSSSKVSASGPEKDPYKVNSNNWYKPLPYGFAFNNRNANDASSSSDRFVIYLPILPSNLNITTHFATNVITTLYGIIEEHSEVRYYDITITGTTGISPQYIGIQNQQPANESISLGRTSFEGLEDVINLGGALPEVNNIINQVRGRWQDIKDSLSGGPSNTTGIDPEKTGYKAFHEFYKFLLQYKKDAAGVGIAGNKQRNVHPIQFLNYKDGVQYDCVPMDFSLTRSAASPMLYNYTIRMRAFNLRNIGNTVESQDQLARLGLGGLQSQTVFSSLTNAAGNAATLISGLL
jgi:hypothetical protein